MSSSVKMLERITNAFLKKELPEMKISIEASDSIKLSFINKKKESINYNELSGGEKARINVALGFAQTITLGLTKLSRTDNKTEIAKKLEISREQLYRIMNGISVPSVQTLIKIVASIETNRELVNFIIIEENSQS